MANSKQNVRPLFRDEVDDERIAGRMEEGERGNRQGLGRSEGGENAGEGTFHARPSPPRLKRQLART